MKKIAVLTSSRADYGIYLPLLKEIKNERTFDLKIIVFGTHLSLFHGYTLNQIISDGFDPAYQIESMLEGDSANAISTAMSLTSLKFADFWKDHHSDFDLVFCLGDRYEMFAAVTAGIPFRITFAHIHGGEKTLGSIDNIFRNSITLASKYHFVSCEEHARRVMELTETKENIFNVGSLSLDNLQSISILSVEDFLKQYGVDLSSPTILITVHPETVSPEVNILNIEKLVKVLLRLGKYQVLITLPNADTNNHVIRDRFMRLPEESQNRIRCFENLGTKGYFTAMKYCSFLLGNTSSGIIEAASLGKWVINLGDRQKGRQQSSNTLNVPFNEDIIRLAIDKLGQSPVYSGTNIYYKGNVAATICSVVKTLY